jgi:hypothetical protein
VVRRAAGDQVDLLKRPEVVLGDLHLLEVDMARVQGIPAHQGVPDGSRLLVDLLEHEVLEAALLCHDGIPGDPLNLLADGAARSVQDPDAAFGDHSDLVVVQEEHVPCVVEDRRDVGRHEELAVPEAHHQGRPVPRRHDLLRLPRIQRGQGVHPLQPGDRLLNGRLEWPRVVLLDQVSDHLGVGLSFELVPPGGELLLEGQVILYDAVMDHHDVARAVAMGMGVLLGGPAVGGPAGVPQAEHPVERRALKHLLQVPELSGAAPELQLAPVHDRDPRGVVASVLHAPEAVQNYGNDLLAADISDDPTHDRVLLSASSNSCRGAPPSGGAFAQPIP